MLLNTSARDRGLGTGGYALVVALPDRLPPDPPRARAMSSRPGTRRCRRCVLGVDEQESPHHELLADADDLGGMPVVVADLHSALPAVIAGVRAPLPDGDGRAATRCEWPT